MSFKRRWICAILLIVNVSYCSSCIKKIIINMLEANRDKVSTWQVTQQLDSELVEAAESICTVRLIERRDGK